MECPRCHNDSEFITDGSDHYWCKRCGESMGRMKKLRSGPTKSSSDLEALFLALWKTHAPPDLPQPQPQLQLIPGKNHACDFTWPYRSVVVEVDGGQHKPGGGRHNTDADRWKCNELTSLGYRVFHVSGEMLKSDPLIFIEQVVKALREGK